MTTLFKSVNEAECIGFQVEVLPNSSIKFVSFPEAHKIDETTWENLERQMRSPTITPRSNYELKTCWLNKLAVIAMYNNEIISYTSLVPIYDECRRKLLSSYLNISYTKLPTVNVYETVASWTDPKWRLKGISKSLKHRLYESSLSGPGEIGMAACYGLAASPVFVKMGWKLVSWDEYKFVRHLLGWIENKKYFWLRSKSIDPIQWKPYNGKHLTIEEFPIHNWDAYCHVWVQSVEKIQKLNTQFSNLTNNDIIAWKNALKKLTLHF